MWDSWNNLLPLDHDFQLNELKLAIFKHNIYIHFSRHGHKQRIVKQPGFSVSESGSEAWIRRNFDYALHTNELYCAGREKSFHRETVRTFSIVIYIEWKRYQTLFRRSSKSCLAGGGHDDDDWRCNLVRWSVAARDHRGPSSTRSELCRQAIWKSFKTLL